MSTPSDNNGRQCEYEPYRMPYRAAGHEQGEGRMVQSDSVRLSYKLVCHLPPLCSSFLFLSASRLHGDGWGLWWSTTSMFLLSGLSVYPQLSPSANRGRARPENAALIEGWAAEPLYTWKQQSAGMTLQPDIIFKCLSIVYTRMWYEETVPSFKRYRCLLWMKRRWQQGNYYNQAIDSRQEAHVQIYPAMFPVAVVEIGALDIHLPAKRSSCINNAVIFTQASLRSLSTIVL